MKLLPSIFSLVFFSLSIFVASATESEFAFIDGSGFVRELRGSEFVDIHGRRLRSSWSWTNLLFHVGVCKPNSNCPSGPPKGPLHCGCPDCSKPHPQGWLNGYCDSSSGGSSKSSGSGSSSSSSGGSDRNGVSEGSSFGEDGSSGSSRSIQSASRVFNPMALVISAAVLATLVVAFVMRKRESNDEQDAAEPVDASGMQDGTDYTLVGGLSTVFAGVMAKMGLQEHGDESTAPDSDEMAGQVSRRLALLRSGAKVPPLNDSSSAAPEFINIPMLQGASTSLAYSETGIEIERPTRPSAYAV